MTTMITNLPRDLMEDIVSRVPLKSMRAVRLTCREWNTLSKSRSFTKLHIGKTSAATNEDEGESRMIVIKECNLYLMSVFVNDTDPSTELKGKLTCLNEQVKISHVFHCDGLLLCILKDDDTKVVVWNPYWGQTRWIETRYSLRPECGTFDRFSYALGYENKKSRRSHKLLRFIDTGLFESGNEFLWYEIYDFDSDLWTTLEFTPYWHIYLGKNSVTVKGNTYWWATEQNYGWNDHIICFDFTTERFGPLLPLPCPGNDLVTLSCVREEMLAVLCQNRGYPHSFEIWITTMIEAEKVSWSKFLKVDAGSYADIPLSHGNFSIDEVKKVAMFFGEKLNRYVVNIIGEAGYVRQVDLEEPTEEICWPRMCSYWCIPHMCSYVPSLVEIKQPKGGQRKEQSILEKRLYCQNLLRLSVFKWRCIRLAAALREKIRMENKFQFD